MSTNEGTNFEVIIEDFAKRHYIKLFHKKYKKAWQITETAIIAEIERIDNVIGKTDKAETIKCNGDYLLIKLNFRVAGTKDSAKASGNRAVIFVDNETRICKVLLVYSKNEICQPNETQKWQEVIKSNYSEIWANFNK